MKSSSYAGLTKPTVLMADPFFHEEHLEEWKDLLTQGEKLRAGKWLFRGMQSSAWKLEPSLERACKKHYEDLSNAPHIENILIREFRRRYRNHSVEIPNPVGIEWLSLMQHYGAPTRLLDFTYSFFIAAYFAMEYPCEQSSSCTGWANTWIGAILKGKPQNSHAIWAVRNEWVAEKGIKLLSRDVKDTDYLENEQNERQWESQKLFFESLLHLRADSTEERIELSRKNPPCVFPLNGMKLNERSTIQQGAFLCPANVTQPFQDNLTKLDGFDNPENLVKLVIPGTLRLEALERLHTMNINRAALFPGLEGFAASLAIYHPLAFGSGQNS